MAALHILLLVYAQEAGLIARSNATMSGYKQCAGDDNCIKNKALMNNVHCMEMK